MSNIPDDVVPYAALNDGVEDGNYEASPSLGDDFAPGADQDGENNG